MRAEVEVIAGIIRVLDDSAPVGGDYEMAITFVADGSTVTLKALRAEGFNGKHVQAIRDALRRHGFKEAIWHRANGRTTRTII